jgi:hypothetical protein
MMGPHTIGLRDYLSGFQVIDEGWRHAVFGDEEVEDNNGRHTDRFEGLPTWVSGH